MCKSACASLHVRIHAHPRVSVSTLVCPKDCARACPYPCPSLSVPKWSGNDPRTLTAYPDSNGIRVASNVTGTIYVAYKKAWTDTYGNGESGTVSEVPSEWAEFMAYDAARSYRASQDSDSGFNPNPIRTVWTYLFTTRTFLAIRSSRSPLTLVPSLAPSCGRPAARLTDPLAKTRSSRPS